MGHQEAVAARCVTINKKRALVLKILDDSLAVNGLKEKEQAAAVAMLEPQAEETPEDMLKRLAGRVENMLEFRAGIKGRLLQPDIASMDDVGQRLLQEINDDWIEALEEAKHNAYARGSFKLNSTRVLISEIYTRLAISALREDSKLVLPKTRAVWIDVMQTFVEKLRDDRYSLDIQGKFKDQIEKIHIRWSPWIRAVVCQINDVQLAKTTISSNLEYMKSLHSQVMRYLIVAIAGSRGASKIPPGSLAKKELGATLKNCCLSRIDSHRKIHGEVPQLADSRSWILNAEMQLKQEDLQSFGLLSSNEFILHQLLNTVVSISQDPSIVQLVGLLNWTKAIISLVERIDRVINIAGWVPILLKMMDFEKLDRQIDEYEKVFNKLIDPTKDEYGIKGTKLREELGDYNIKASGYNRSKVLKMSCLQSEELLNRIRDILSDAFIGVMRLGQLLDCNIVSDAVDKSLSTVTGVDDFLFENKQEDECAILKRVMKNTSIVNLEYQYEKFNQYCNASSKVNHKRKGDHHSRYEGNVFFGIPAKTIEKLTGDEVDLVKQKMDDLTLRAEELKRVFDRKFQ